LESIFNRRLHDARFRTLLIEPGDSKHPQVKGLFLFAGSFKRQIALIPYNTPAKLNEKLSLVNIDNAYHNSVPFIVDRLIYLGTESFKHEGTLQ